MTNLNNKVKELFKAGVHLGHKKNRIHPKAKKYIYTMQNGVSVIDLTKTAELLENAIAYVKKLKKENQQMLVVLTKKSGSSFTQELCNKNSIPYITVKWPAGLFSNFDMIIKNVNKLNKMKEDKEKGNWKKFVKHEQVKLTKELRKLEHHYGGISKISKLPDAIFIVDIKKEKNAVKESRELKIPIVAVCDTNVNPDIIDYPIPGNDDSETSIEYLVKEIINAYTKN